jgi:hypothetical protein
MIVQDVPLSGKAMHKLNLSSVSNARNCKSALGVGVFFGGPLRLAADIAVAYEVPDSESENSDGISTCWHFYLEAGIVSITDTLSRYIASLMDGGFKLAKQCGSCMLSCQQDRHVSRLSSS